MDKFLLFAARRSGTSFLISSLNSHPQVHCFDDVFHRKRLKNLFYFEKPGTPFFKYGSASIKRRLDYLFRRKELIGAFLAELYASVNGSKAVVVRIVYPHEYPEVLEWAIENDVGIIHNLRENYLKSIVYYSGSKAGSPTVRLSPSLLQKRLAARVEQIEKYRVLFKNHRYCEVSNEALMANGAAESRRLLDFLGVDSSIPLTFGRLKQDHGEVEEILENYEEIAQAFRGTDFEKYLAR